MKKVRVLVVAPYSGLEQLVLSVKDDYEDYDIDIAEGNLEVGLQMIGELGETNYDVVLSRGGTAELIERSISIPVIYIGISGYDILRLIRLAQNYAEKTAWIGFPSLMRGCRAVCELLQIEMEMHTIESESEVEPLLLALRQKGEYVVIGDAITTAKASRLGINNIFAASGEESVRNALDDAGRFTRVFRKKRQQAEVLLDILADMKTPVVLFDEHQIFQQTFGQNTQEIVSEDVIKKLRRQIPGVLRNGKTEGTLGLNDGTKIQYIGKCLPSSRSGGEVASSAFYLQKLQLSFGQGVKVLYIKDDVDKSEFNALVSENDQMKAALESAELLTGADTAVFIQGERGTSKTLLAQMLHSKSRFANSAFIILDCDFLRGGQCEQALSEITAALLSEEYTLFLKHVNVLEFGDQRALMNVLRTLGTVRIMASVIQDFEHNSNEDAFLQDLHIMLGYTTILLPPLRERKDDLGELFHRIVTKANVQYGKQVVGINPKAMDLLRKYDWIGNMDQFTQVVIDAVRLEKSVYVGEKVLETLLSEVNQAKWSQGYYSGKTLDELEREIIKAVFHDSDMNQSETARRLGVSRTTMWRKIKELGL